MSTKFGKIKSYRFHVDPKRFEEVAYFINTNYKGKVRRIADVAGGRGMLSRILAKKYNFEVDTIDPRGFSLKGVNNRKEEYSADFADFYDLIVGLHPDQALVEVVLSSLVRPVIVIPCCNFWSKTEKLGRDSLLKKIEQFCNINKVGYKRIIFNFEGPKNIGLVLSPPNLN